MKCTLLLLMLAASFTLLAQESSEAFRLGVKNSLKSDGKFAYFKPNKKLEIYTNQGRLVSGHYSLNQNSVIFNKTDIIPLKEISIVTGGIKKSNWVKAGAWALIAGGAFVGWTKYDLSRWAAGWSNGSPSIAPSIPFFFVSGIGVSILVMNKYSIRTYEMKDNWELTITKK